MGIVKEGLKILREEGLKPLIWRASSYMLLRIPIGYIYSLLIAVKFRNAVSSIDSIHDALDFAFSFQAFGVSIKPIQVKYEIAKLLEIVAALRPRVVLEIGTAGGGTLSSYSRGPRTQMPRL